MNTETKVDVLAVMDAQRARRAAMRSIVKAAPAARKRRKAITKADVAAAVNAALDAAARELREHEHDFPRWKQAMDFAIAVVAKHKEPRNV